MGLPLYLNVQIASHNGTLQKPITIHRGLTVLLGPNGSGKTHFLRGLKNILGQHAGGKRVRFLSAGRMGLLEQYRSDYDGHRGGNPLYDQAIFGTKGDVARRHQIETLTGDFQTLAERADIFIKIQERLKKLFKRDLFVEWDGGNLKVSFARLSRDTLPYSSGREASGLMHLVGILAALYDDEVGALLIDEPEVSLHPQLQAFLLKEILSIAGIPSQGTNKKLVVFATHSTEMIQITTPQDLLSLVFCYDLNTNPVQVAADAGELGNKKIQSLIARLGQEHKLSLFCKQPLLVEGPSDVIVCTAVANKFDLSLEAAGSQLLPVVGKGQMPIVAKLMTLLGKSPVVLTDADGIADGLELVGHFLKDNKDADQLANTLGFESAYKMANAIFADFCQLVDKRWVEISVRAELHPYWTNRNTGEEPLAQRRSAFSTLFHVSASDLESLSSDGAWLSIKARFSALLDLLEASGLFVLRRGSIESYYFSLPDPTSIGKPAAAATEMEEIDRANISLVELQYNDVYRCIRYASNSDVLDEAGALRDLLLAVVAPAHTRLKAGDKSSDFNLLARSILGDRSRIFSLTVQNDSLVVSIESKILRVGGFPLVIRKDDDVIKAISRALASGA